MTALGIWIHAHMQLLPAPCFSRSLEVHEPQNDGAVRAGA